MSDDVSEIREEIEQLQEVFSTQNDLLRERVSELEEENEQLRSEISRLQDMTEVFSQMRRSMASTPEERAIMCIKALYNDAWRSGKKGRTPSSSLTVREGKAALGGNVDRERLYPAFERAVTMVGNEELLEYRKEDRSSQRNSRLILDLRGEEMPIAIGGYSVRLPDGTPVEADSLEQEVNSLE